MKGGEGFKTVAYKLGKFEKVAYNLGKWHDMIKAGVYRLKAVILNLLTSGSYISHQIKRLTRERTIRDVTKSSKQTMKTKQGLAGVLNGLSVSALADTGSRKNVISQSYAKSLKLKIRKSSCDFQLGSSRRARSIGTVSLEWAFAKDPKEIVPIVCHVLPNCIYDLILGNDFLTATQTLSRYRDRLTQCSFSTSNNIAQFCFLGETDQRLQCTLGDAHNVCAVPDTGAERNVIDMDYALEKGLEIKRNDKKLYLGFADGTCQETEGRVDTHWTFSNGERIPITFDVLKNCCSDVIIGEEVLTEHNVFEDHTSSIIAMPYESDFHPLAPFDFVRTWQRPFEKINQKLSRKPKPSDFQSNSDESANHQSPNRGGIQAEEQRRRDIWNYKYDFGATATTVERDLERQRRERYASGLAGAVWVINRGIMN